MFHGVLLERRGYGSIGFNVPYDFNDGDLGISTEQLKMFLDDNATDSTEIPFKVLHYTCSEVNYGGKITDGQDRILTNCLIEDFYRYDYFYINSFQILN